MFNLEHAMTGWRQQMLASGIQSPVPLEELEIHLREEIERRIQSGLNGQRAFETSVQHLGLPETLQKEFKQIERNIMKKIMMIGAGVMGIAIGMAFVMPAVAQYRHAAATSGLEIGLFLLGVAITLAGAGMAISGLKKSRA